MGEQRSLMLGANFVMFHAAASMTGMWDPSKRFGEIVTGIEDPSKMLHDEMLLLAPFLDGKMLDVDLPSMGSGVFLMEHVESWHIINKQVCWTRSKSVKTCEIMAKRLLNLAMATKQKSMTSPFMKRWS